MTQTRPLPELEVFADPEALARHAADWLLRLSLQSKERFAIALAGGQTPRRLYETMASPFYRERFAWPRLHWFWGDERCVPHGDPRSNYKMADDALLSRVPVPRANIHPVETEGLAPEQAAARYEQTLQAFHGAARLDPANPLFDAVLLGLGEDGHTASLFPGSAVLDERTRWAAAVTGMRDEPRVTLTYPALQSARNVVFLVSGAAKRSMLERLLKGDNSLPASRVRPQGALRVFADGEAARGLEREQFRE